MTKKVRTTTTDTREREREKTHNFRNFIREFIVATGIPRWKMNSEQSSFYLPFSFSRSHFLLCFYSFDNKNDNKVNYNNVHNRRQEGISVIRVSSINKKKSIQQKAQKRKFTSLNTANRHQISCKWKWFRRFCGTAVQDRLAKQIEWEADLLGKQNKNRQRMMLFAVAYFMCIIEGLKLMKWPRYGIAFWIRSIFLVKEMLMLLVVFHCIWVVNMFECALNLVFGFILFVWRAQTLLIRWQFIC